MFLEVFPDIVCLCTVVNSSWELVRFVLYTMVSC